MKLINIFKQTLKEYELKKPEKIYQEPDEKPKSSNRYKNDPTEDPYSNEIKVKRTLVNNFSKEEKVIIGNDYEIDDSEGTPMFVIKKDGTKLANIMYDKKNKEFIDGMENLKYVYEPLSNSAKFFFMTIKSGRIDMLKNRGDSSIRRPNE